MASEQQTYLAVLRATYEYEPQADAEDELAIKENQLLLLLEQVDEDWWRVKIKPDSQDEDGLSGLVPSAYVEPAEHISVVKTLYDYEAAQPGELSVKEDELLYVYDKDDDWLLVHSQKEEGTVGYVPGNYVEEATAEGETSPSSPPLPDLSSIVIPDSPPKPAYTDPEELVNRSKAKAQAGSVETWSISEVDKKGKKKKGTLGVGNGAMFFASESDKTPVQKWQTSDLEATRIEKTKHVHVDVGGSNPISLHFHAGSKDVADAILAKIEASRPVSVPSPVPESLNEIATAEAPERPRSSAQKSVHFDNSEPLIIPPRSDEGEPEEEEPVVHETHIDADGEQAVVLYDFNADGEDEMTVHEGETLVVLERDTDEWWKCRNEQGDEGVVPANYLEMVSGGGGASASAPAPVPADEYDADAEAEAEAEVQRREKEIAERKEKERKKAEADQRAKAAAAAAEADRRRREKEREKQREKEKERERVAAVEEARQTKLAQRDSSSEETPRSPSGKKTNGQSSGSRGSLDKRPPPTDNIRTWHDRTGQFRVEAAFLGFAGGKLRLHKTNGVVIEVPSEKMSAEDMRYVEKVMNKHKRPSSPRRNSDDEPLEERRRSLQPSSRATSSKKGPTIDWFPFFLEAGCDVDDCTRYAQSFERDKIDEAILPDITESTMRSLGLREGDIIRVKKAIEQRRRKSPDDARAEQLRRDEELARQLQAEETGGSSRSPAPNLFAGPNGALKNNVRRGRPQPSKSLPPPTVDLQSISTASDQIKRTGTPTTIVSPSRTGTSPTPVQPPSRSNSAAIAGSGFDDDAWTNRPSSTKPIAPSSPAATRAPSVPPIAPTPPAPPAPPAPAPAAAAPVASPPPAPAPAPAQQPAPTGLANKTEADIFDQLARLRVMQTQSPAINNRPMSAAPNMTPSLGIPPVVSPPPMGYQSGMGMGSSPTPMGQHLHAQQTGMFQPPQAIGPRGPLAPIPANQSLLQPLVPTTTGFNSFVPTRPQSAPFQPNPTPSFLSTQPTGFAGPSQHLFSQPTGFQPSQPLMSQPTGFQPSGQLMSQPTGFQPSGQLMSQPTGFQPSGQFMSQPTGMPNGGFSNSGSFGNIGGGMSGLPSFQGNGGFTPVQSNPTGFNPNLGPFHTVSPPPLPPTQPAVNTNPANIFAQMKSGTFGNDSNTPSSQSADKYDALRPNPTGWGGGYQGANGYSGGYGYQH